MLKVISLVLLLAVGFSLHAEEAKAFTHSYLVTSTVMNENRLYHVYLPPSYYDNKQRRFPVVYVLDGDIHRTRAIAGMIEGLSTPTLEEQVQQAIVVAIPNSTNAIRERDLTPTNVDWELNGRLLEKFEDIGNAANYLYFFKSELIPQIDSQFRTSDKRLLVGESFGGLFAAYALLNTPDVFTHYLIIDATYLWDNNYLNRTLSNKQAQGKLPAGNVYFTFANNTAFGEIGETNLAWGYQFFDKLNAIQSDELRLHKRYFDDESHGTVALPSWYYGFKALLKTHSE
ncbi:alpha/beta hydrolase [Alteromonas stellipolaris]|jgi:predicted alpha/beta superfamily hydrolase|uniref:Alpha/beta hydrolase-fold protein n=1 Tax=Alteromonas stellipolaris TaxID=233316 RepID=A0AAW7YYS1_9ALTE|nr:alpha/beta hydrolase-fold protein [Alteromonas stellipolaris]MDO6533677.1 alpha/beta hydrolase-fold protein [Alteromonas stellipolaris]MDO6576907.1 alpha/beta hydrolase-fold protein [Alteromonas stellipolaris]MDO6625329.1 alpha/beta hydrolase-fold protein [Alteromonas stellipolaris]